MIRYNKGITLIALVITIVIMLLLAGIALQITFGDNGLVIKANKAKLEQKKEELYEKSKLIYLSLNTKQKLENDNKVNYQLIFSDSEFLKEYNILEENITDKKGNIIDTKKNVLDRIMNDYKSVEKIKENNKIKPEDSNYTIREEDKEKLILRLKVNRYIGIKFDVKVDADYTQIDYGDGNKERIYLNEYKFKDYSPGEYIIKVRRDRKKN